MRTLAVTLLLAAVGCDKPPEPAPPEYRSNVAKQLDAVIEARNPRQ